jgi:hypothetical protein
MPEINYVVANAIANNSYFFPILTQYPISTSQTSSFFKNMVWQKFNDIG